MVVRTIHIKAHPPQEIKRSPAKTGLREASRISKANIYPPFSPLDAVHPADARHSRRNFACT